MIFLNFFGVIATPKPLKPVTLNFYVILLFLFTSLCDPYAMKSEIWQTGWCCKGEKLPQGGFVKKGAPPSIIVYKYNQAYIK